MKKSKQVVNFFYSVGYYKDTNAVCAIFSAEIGLEIDEAFKVNILKLERKIDEIKMDSPNEVLDLMYQDDQITNMILQRMQDQNSLAEAKNQINLFELERHKLTLEPLKAIFSEYDPQRLGRIPVDSFRSVCAKMKVPGEEMDDIVEQAAKGKQQHSVTFTNAVLALHEFVFTSGDDEEEVPQNDAPVATAEVEKTKGLKMGDL